MPPPRDLESVRDVIFSLFNEGKSYAEILIEVNSLLHAQGSSTISLRTLKSALHRWQLSRQIDLMPLYEDISELFDNRRTNKEILDIVNQIRTSQGEQIIGITALKNQLAYWGLTRQIHTIISTELIERVRFYFYTYGYSDSSIVRDIQSRDNIPITLHAVRRIRWQNGMKRRFRTADEREAALQKAISFLEADLQRSSMIRGLGRGHLYNYVRLKGQVLVSQNRLYDFYRSVFPEEVQHRREGNFKHRTDFTVPGPNFLWCLDGYEKLKRFGFQIYACIDAYSRCVIWFYIGRSATTSISTLKQYLRTIQHLGMRPFFTRSDHGVETPLWVAAQAMLAQAGPADITYEDENNITHHYRQGNRIQSCHMYGPSTKNVRVESWWRQLRFSATDRWIVS